MNCLKLTLQLNAGPTFAVGCFRGICVSSALMGTPKHRRPPEVVRKRRGNIGHYHKFLKGLHMMITCDACGNLYKKYHMCPTCYDQTRFETEIVRKVLKAKNVAISSETVLQYKDDIDEHLRLGKSDKNNVISIENRNRPAGWFNQSYWNKM